MLDQDNNNYLFILVIVLALLVFSIKRTDGFANCANFDTNLGQAEIKQYYDEMNKNIHYTHSAPAPELN